MTATLSKDEIFMLVKVNKEILETKFRLLSIGLFGSYARGDNNQNRDIDFFVELKKQSFSDYAGLELYLENLFH